MNVGIATDRVLDSASGNCKVYDIHGLVAVHHGIDQAAGEGVAAAHAIQNVEGEQSAFKSMIFIPEKGFQAVFAAAVGVAYMAGDTLDIRISCHKCLKDLVLLFIARLQRHAVLDIAPAVVRFILPEMVGFDTEEDVHIRKVFGAVVPGFFPGPEFAAEIAVEADGDAFFLLPFFKQFVINLWQFSESAGVMPLRWSQVKPSKRLSRSTVLKSNSAMALCFLS